MLYLLGLGFAVGLSGVLIPGPLLVYTISETLRKGFVGHIIILGHILVEVGIVVALTLGLAAFISSPTVQRVVGVAGGAALLLTGLYMLRLSLKKVEIAKEQGAKYKPLLGGLVFTAFNPTFPAWWASVGSLVVFESLRVAGILGVAVMMVGHWMGDVSWYSFVSYTAHRSDRFIGQSMYRAVITAMGFVLIFIGVYFLF